MPLLEGEQAYTLNGVRVGVCPGIGPEGGFGGLPTPLLVLSARSKLCTLLCLGQKKVPYFCSRLFRSGNWDFGSFLYLSSRICLNCACTVLFFVFCFFFHSGGQVCIFLPEDKFMQVQALQHCSKGSQVPQPISECIIYLFALSSLCQVYVT